MNNCCCAKDRAGDFKEPIRIIGNNGMGVAPVPLKPGDRHVSSASSIIKFGHNPSGSFSDMQSQS